MLHYQCPTNGIQCTHEVRVSVQMKRFGEPFFCISHTNNVILNCTLVLCALNRLYTDVQYTGDKCLYRG